MASSPLLFAALTQVLLLHSQSYIKHSKTLSHNNAESLCLFEYSQSLASIHDVEHNEEAAAICDGSVCWIGLYFDDALTPIWTDESVSDFATNTTGGVYPWATNQPNGNSECVRIY